MFYQDDKFLEVLKLLDELLASENPTVKDLISQAVLVQTMENPNREHEYVMGPFQQMFNEIRQLRADLNRACATPGYFNQQYYNYPGVSTTPGTGTFTVGTVPGGSYTGGVGAGPMYSGYQAGYGPTPSVTIGNISLDSMASTGTYDDPSWYTSNDTISITDIDWNKYFSNYVKTEADASDPKPAEDFYAPEKTETALTATKLKELLDKLKY